MSEHTTKVFHFCHTGGGNNICVKRLTYTRLHDSKGEPVAYKVEAEPCLVCHRGASITIRDIG